MKKKLLRIATSICFMVCVMFLGQVTAFAATIGSVLSAPESGWQRYDDTNEYFYYQGAWFLFHNGSHAYYKGGMSYSKINGATIKFKFKGSKLRITEQILKVRSNKIQVKIDDVIVGTYSLYDPKLSTDQCLVFEKNNLAEGVHYVELTNLDSGLIPNSDDRRQFCFDAIDIDSTGELLPYDKEKTDSNLKATGGDSKVDLTWGAVFEATSYTVKRSTNAGGPYTTIATNITSTTYTDTDVTNGSTYYYVVTATAGGRESNNSNEAPATPSDTTGPGDTTNPGGPTDQGDTSDTSDTVDNKLKVVLEPTEQLQLSVDDDLDENADMSWTSSDTSVATVNGNGVVTALAPGNTKITVTSDDGTYTDYINVLVVEDADDYRLAVDLKVGQTSRLTIDDLTDTVKVKWVSMDSSIAKVSSKGKVKAVSEGLALVTALDKDGNIIGKVYVRVRE